MYLCMYNVRPYINTNVHSQQSNAAGVGVLVVVERALTDSCTMERNCPSASQLIAKLHMFTMGRKNRENDVVVNIDTVLLLFIIGSRSVAVFLRGCNRCHLPVYYGQVRSFKMIKKKTKKKANLFSHLWPLPNKKFKEL